MKLQVVFKRAFLLLLCSLARIFAEVILDGPQNLTVEPGQWGNFTCRISCTHFVVWYVEGFERGEVETTCTETLDGQTICMETVQSCASQTSTAEFVSRLRVFGQNEFSGMDIAVQCGAIGHVIPLESDPCPPYLSYSRFASLRVRPQPVEITTETPTTVDSPTQLPSPTAVVCPSVTADVTTITETVRETVTSTVYLSSTVTVSAEPTDLPNYPSKAAATHGSTHFGRVITELLTWFVTIMAGIVFL